MNTKHKSFPLLIIVVIAIVLFISAIVMKQIQPDNSEAITVSSNLKTKQIVKQISTIEEVETLETSIIDDIVTNELNEIASPVTNSKTSLLPHEKKANRAKLEKKLNMHLMLNTPEKIITVITALKEQGREDEANDYIEFLLEKFPDYDF